MKGKDMFHSARSLTHAIWAVALFILLAVSACQSPQPKCCEIEFGLIRAVDLTGNWDLAEGVVQDLTTATSVTSRYEQSPIVDRARQYLLRNSSSPEPAVSIFQELRRYEGVSPRLKALDSRMFSNIESGLPYDPGVVLVGESSQARCQSDNPSKPERSLTLCEIEVRYRYLISLMHFEFAGPIREVDLREIMNQALSMTDQRIKQIDQHIAELAQ